MNILILVSDYADFRITEVRIIGTLLYYKFLLKQ
jgi:hypothetical protein